MGKEKNEKQILAEINYKMDKILVILLADKGLKKSEVAKAMKVSEKTIQRMIPFNKIKSEKNA
jgi:transposase